MGRAASVAVQTGQASLLVLAYETVARSPCMAQIQKQGPWPVAGWGAESPFAFALGRRSQHPTCSETQDSSMEKAAER